jgi:hypothetical protein
MIFLVETPRHRLLLNVSVCLSVVAPGLGLYATWRFWEAITGEGYDQYFSKLKNFFKFRLSPFVSGCVYSLYLGFIIYLITKVPSRLQLQQVVSHFLLS